MANTIMSGRRVSSLCKIFSLLKVVYKKLLDNKARCIYNFKYEYYVCGMTYYITIYYE